MSTIAEQAQELAATARRLHRQPITRSAIDAAVAATKPVAVAHTPEVSSPHKGGCDCAACVRHRDGNFNEEKTAEAERKGAVAQHDGHPADCRCADCLAKRAQEDEEGEDGIGSTVASLKGAAQSGAAVGRQVAGGKVPGVDGPEDTKPKELHAPPPAPKGFGKALVGSAKLIGGKK